AMRADPQNPFVFSSTLGAVLYRAGRVEEAIQQLQNAIKTFEQPGANNLRTSSAYPWFFRALAHQRHGNAEESRRCLAKATELADREMKDEIRWNRKLTLQLLQIEAKAAIDRTQEKKTGNR